MAITDVKKLYKAPSAKTTAQERTRNTDMTQYWQVITDAVHDENYILTNAPLFGAPGDDDRHESNFKAFVVDREATLLEGSTLVWEMTVRYSTELVAGQGSGPPVVRSITTRKIQEVMRFDAETNQLIQNTAGIPYEPNNLKVPRSHRVATYTRTEHSFNEDLADQYIDRVNATAWKGKQPETVLCQDITAQEEFEADEAGNLISKWIVTYVFEHNPRSWRFRPLSEGWRQLDEGVLKPIVGPHGATLIEPWPLDKDGKALTAAEVREGSKISVGDYALYHKANFNDLGL